MMWETPDGLRVLQILSPTVDDDTGTLYGLSWDHQKRGWWWEAADGDFHYALSEAAAATLEKAAREYLHAHHHFIMPAECRPGICYLLIDFHAADTLEDLAFRAPRFDTYAEALIAGVLKSSEAT